MVRHLFLGGMADWTTGLGADETSTSSQAGKRALFIPGAVLTFWSASTGGTQYTDLLDSLGTAITSVTADSTGELPEIQGPDTIPDTWVMWADGNNGAGPRRKVVATDLANTVDSRISALAMDDLADVLVDSPADGQALRYSASLSAWVNVSDLSESVSAADFGYVADGQQSSAAANTTAIQDAIDSLGANGGTVVLPPGRGYITAPGITLPGRCGLRGAGHYATILVLANGANCHMIKNHVSTDGVTDPNAMFVEISDLGLDGAGAFQTGSGPYYGIYLNTNPAGTIGGADPTNDATHRITNVYTRNTHDEGIYHDGRSDSVIAHCKVSYAGGNAYTIRFDTHVVGCVAEKPAKAGFSIIGSNAMLVNCKAYACGQDSSAFNGQSAVPNSGHGYIVAGGGIGEVQLVNCDAQQVSGHGFYLQSGSLGTVISGCSVGGASYSNGTGFVSYNLDGCSTAIVQGTSLAYTGVSGVRLVNGADGNDVTLTHTSLAGQTAGPVLSADTVTLTNRIFANGLPAANPTMGGKRIVNAAPGAAAGEVATFDQLMILPWAPSTSYVKGQLISYLGFIYQVTTAFTSGASFNLSNKTVITAPIAGTFIPPGQYVFAGGGQSTGTSNSLGTGTLRVMPFYLPHTVTLTGIGAEVTAAGDAGSKYRLGVYADTGSFAPGSLILDAGQIAGDSVGAQTLTISQTLSPGIYWVGGVVQSVTTTQPTIRTVTPGPFPLPWSSAPGTGAGANAYGYTTAISGALPATFTNGGPLGSVARIHLKS